MYEVLSAKMHGIYGWGRYERQFIVRWNFPQVHLIIRHYVYIAWRSPSSESLTYEHLNTSPIIEA